MPRTIAQVVATAVLLAWLFLLHRPLGVPEQWAYRVNPEAWPIGAAAGPVAVVVVLALLAYLVRKVRIAGAAVLLVGLPVVYVGLLAVNPAWLRTAVAYQMSDVSTGYLAEAYRIDDVGAYLRRFSAAEKQGEHLQTRPPGATLLYYGLRRFDEAWPALGDTLVAEGVVVGCDTAYEMWRYAHSFPGAKELPPGSVRVALLAILAVCVATAMAAALLFWIVSGAKGVAVGYLTAAMLGLSPACALFFQCLDMLIVLVAVLAVAAMGKGWPTPWRAFAMGVLLGLGSMVSLSVLGLALAIACVVGGGTEDRRRVVWGLTALAGGIAVVWAAATLVGLRPFDVLENSLAAHRLIAGEESHRSYGLWMWMNVVEFAVFLGLPVFVAAVWRRPKGMTPWAGLAMGAAIVLVAVSLGGEVRGETGRIFAPLMPLVILYLAEAEERPWAMGVTAVLVLVQTVAMALAMQPVSTPF